jgi:hypothetical protein
LGFPTGWLFTTHKDCLLHINYTPPANFLASSPSSNEEEEADIGVDGLLFDRTAVSAGRAAPTCWPS